YTIWAWLTHRQHIKFHHDHRPSFSAGLHLLSCTRRSAARDPDLRPASRADRTQDFAILAAGLRDSRRARDDRSAVRPLDSRPHDLDAQPAPAAVERADRARGVGR